LHGLDVTSMLHEVRTLVTCARYISATKMPGDHHELELDPGGATIRLGTGPAAVEVRDGRFRRLLSYDEALLLAFRRFHSPVRTTIAHALTRAGDAKSWTALGLLCLATRTPLGTHLGLRLASATLGATALAQLLKRGLSRARPDASIVGFEALAANPDRFSFPSGHTAAAFSVAVAFAGEPAGLGPLALLASVGIGLSRVYLGAHYPLDVGAGALLGVVAGIVARLLVP
jgi:undecaprenyl-diphosphatase